MQNLSIIIPAKNEKDNLPIVLKELLFELKNKIKYEIIVVKNIEDNSTDLLNKEIKDQIKIINPNIKGYGAALKYGFENSKFDYVCVFNADGAFMPSDIFEMFRKIRNGYECIFGSRYLKKNSSEDDTFITFIGNKIFTFIGKIFFRLKISDILYTYFICKKELINNLNFSSNNFAICVEIPIKIHRSNKSYSDIICYERKRISGQKSVNDFKDGFLILLKMINLFFIK